LTQKGSNRSVLASPFLSTPVGFEEDSVVGLAIYGDDLIHRLGGTEKSTFALVRELRRNPDLDITVLSGLKERQHAEMPRYPYDSPVTIPLRSVRSLPFLRHSLNTRTVAKTVKGRRAALLFASGHAAPSAINAFDGPSVYFARDEMSLNVSRTYETGAAKRLKFAVRYALDYPFFRRYQRANRSAVRKAALVVADSNHMARRMESVFGRRVLTVYPFVDVEWLSRIQLAPVEHRPYIMMIGDDEVKGLSTFRRIAEALPEHEFLIVGRTLQNEKRGNLTLRSYVSDPVELYGWTRLLLAPSVWEGCCGMAAIEANALGIPAIVSARGGLPETVAASYYAITDYRNVDRWVDKIRLVLHDYARHSRVAKAHARDLNMRKQLRILVDEIRSITGIDLSAPAEEEVSAVSAIRIEPAVPIDVAILGEPVGAQVASASQDPPDCGKEPAIELDAVPAATGDLPPEEEDTPAGSESTPEPTEVKS
jgi:glycosyltransferase involved in cell wall biosynthesis